MMLGSMSILLSTLRGVQAKGLRSNPQMYVNQVYLITWEYSGIAELNKNDKIENEIFGGTD